MLLKRRSSSLASRNRFHIHDHRAMPESQNRIGPSRNKLLGNEALVARFENRPQDGRIVDLLCIIHFRPAWIAGGMVMPDHGVVLLDATNDVPIHDLHMVDVEQELEVR